MKRLAFVGSSQADLRDFPEAARRKAGFQLDRVQRGLEPDDWKPMVTIGSGVCEIRVKEASGAFRLIYVATFAEAVFVLHAFQKKTQHTPTRDIELATARFKELARRMAR
jgi:phage-related protein